MKTITTSNWKPQCRMLCALLLGIPALWAMPRSAQAQLYVSGSNSFMVSEYNATTGAAINPNFITGFLPNGFALSGNNLFVVNSSNGRVGKYDATMGVALNANLLTGPGPLALSGDGTAIFVANNGTIGEYNAITGATINPNFITGLSNPIANGVPTKVISLPTSPIQWGIGAAADFPKTGEADLVWENAVTGEHTIWILNNGVPLSSTKLPTISTEWQIVN